jgi:hypothetical protein
MLKQFRSTCYHGWMASDDLFDGFTIESDILLGIVRTAFGKVFPDSAYIPSVKDVFHQTVSPGISLTCVCSCHDIPTRFMITFKPTVPTLPAMPFKL